MGMSPIGDYGIVSLEMVAFEHTQRLESSWPTISLNNQDGMMPVTLPGIRVECYQSQCQVSGWNYYGIVSLEMVAFEHTHRKTLILLANYQY